MVGGYSNKITKNNDKNDYSIIHLKSAAASQRQRSFLSLLCSAWFIRFLLYKKLCHQHVEYYYLFSSIFLECKNAFTNLLCYNMFRFTLHTELSYWVELLPEILRSVYSGGY